MAEIKKAEDIIKSDLRKMFEEAEYIILLI